MKILITGGAGFLGSHLCEKLAKEHEVIAMDNLITGNEKNLSHAKNVQFVKQDITKPFDVKCDLAFSFASPASPVDYQRHPLETMETNSLGVKNVLENAKKYGAKVVHASTSEIYGDPLESPQREMYWGNVNTLGPRSCYDESKRFAETLCYNYNKKFQSEAILLRIFNTYGPRMQLNDGRAVPNFMTQAIKGENITIYGDGKQTRSFCYVDDLVEGITKLAFSPLKSKFDVFNVGNPEEITLEELAARVKGIAKSSSKIVRLPLPQDDPKKRKPDITKIKNAVGWEPKVKIDEGLKRTFEWFKGEVKK